ncbi:MAG: hypothetical protein OEZ22_13890 [Spirochaetia bacterium]|nr:hypothetical protein [Spirochaetia bacterium]
MQFENNNIFTTKLSDIIAFANFLGKYEAIALHQEIKDKNGNILISAKRPLNENLVKSLLKRDLDNLGEISLVISNTLRDAIAERIYKEFQKIVNLGEFSFPAYLFEKKSLDLKRIIKVTIRNHFFLGYLIKIIFENKNIKNHLIEVSAIAVGLMANLVNKNYKYGHFMRLFQAAILHDYSITNNPNWEEEENFEGKTQHDIQSAHAISGNELSSDISEMILNHNHLKQSFKKDESAKEEEEWFENPVILSSVILNLVEYYTHAKRIISQQKGNKDEMTLVSYQIALQTEMGFFPIRLLRLFESYFTKYTKFFKYGEEIAIIQNACQYKKYALAYPKPKATQILCKNSKVTCEEFRLYGQPLMVVVPESDTWIRLGENIPPGWHDKCKLSLKLPKPPDNF